MYDHHKYGNLPQFKIPYFQVQFRSSMRKCNKSRLKLQLAFNKHLIIPLIVEPHLTGIHVTLHIASAEHPGRDGSAINRGLATTLLVNQGNHSLLQDMG